MIKTESKKRSLNFGWVAVAVVAVVFVVPAVSEAETYNFVLSWGTYGTGDGEFYNPHGIAVDSSDNVFVTDYRNNRIQKFDSSGTFLAKWGSLGTGDGEFYKPLGIAVDSSGNVYVADRSNQRIQKFDSDGNFQNKWGSHGTGDGQFRRPSGIAVDSSGNVYVADTENYRIQKFDPSGAFLAKWGSGGTGDGQFNYPCGIALDSSGNVYVADTHNNHIQKFDSSGTFLAKWGSQGSGDGEFLYPDGIAADSSDNVYVADAGNNRIQKFDSSGTFLAKWGIYGTGDGKFIHPNDITLDSSGNVYVADTYNHRIQKFAPPVSANQAPIADAGPDQTVEQDSHAGASVTLDGSGSSDPDGDSLTYSWTWDGGSASVVSPTVVLPLGTTTITLVVNDGTVNSDADTVDITLVDTTPPTIHSVLASPDVLWPPNHEMVEVIVSVDATDICDAAPVCWILGVNSNEPINGPGDGNTEPDWEYTDEPLLVLLRAESAGVGTGRVYTILVECMDASGNITSVTVEVIVPHDQGEGKQ